ncbi:MAG TPA: class I SAM-dependent RNA methyltransferase [Methylomirabilota bacterium]|nr:class I SAM-dependent RNA methyltransferase [Methylomirabilota bacterium]
MTPIASTSRFEPTGAPPFEPGDRITLRIEDIAFGGEGVGRVEQFVVFVPFVIPNETVEVEITGIKRTFARARLLRVTGSPAHRVSPPCRYFGDCGGCQYQHIDYPGQLALKRKQITDLLQRIGGFPDSAIDPVIPCPSPYHYRNRIMIRSQWDKFKQGLNLGFIRHDNRLVVDVEECRIAEPALNEAIRRVRDNPPPKGGLKVMLRMTPEDWDVPRDSFFQNNFHLLPRLVETVRGAVRDAGSQHLIDLYCGVGFFALELAPFVRIFAGVEVDAAAIRAARKNAARRAATNGEFIQGRSEDILPGLLDRFDPALTTLIMDPPRTGCHQDSLELLRGSRPSQILYVSCHPATLARDLKSLCADGTYHLARVTPLDMFPQTQHVECVADLRLVQTPIPARPSHVAQP